MDVPWISNYLNCPFLTICHETEIKYFIVQHSLAAQPVLTRDKEDIRPEIESQPGLGGDCRMETDKV